MGMMEYSTIVEVTEVDRKAAAERISWCCAAFGYIGDNWTFDFKHDGVHFRFEFEQDLSAFLLRWA